MIGANTILQILEFQRFEEYNEIIAALKVLENKDKDKENKDKESGYISSSSDSSSVNGDRLPKKLPIGKSYYEYTK